MISNHLKTLVLFSIFAFSVHGAEEYLTGFYNTDSFSRFFFQIFESMSSLQATFLLFQICIAILLTVVYLLLRDGKPVLYLATFLGLIFLFELHHLVKAVMVQSYYSGIISAIFIYVLGYFYWKELIKNWSKK